MKRWIFVLMAIAGVAIAGTVNIVDQYVFQALFRPWSRTTAQLPAASAWTGYVAYNSTNTGLTASDGTSWRTATPLFGSTTYDFPVLGNAVLGTPTAVSWAVAVPGAALGMSCSPGSNLGVDGGTALATEALLSCDVTAANAAKLKLHVEFTDGGTYDLGDAGFYLRVFN